MTVSMIPVIRVIRIGDEKHRARWLDSQAYLLHDAGFTLGESNVATRLILDELDLDLSTFASGLVVIIIVVVDVLVRSGALDATVGITGSERAVAIAGTLVVMAGRGIGIVVSDFCGHDVDVWEEVRIGYCV